MAASNGRVDERHQSLQSSNQTKRTTKKVQVPEGFKAGPPEGGFGWTVLAGILLVTIMMSVPGTAFSIMLQDILVSMNASTSMTSWGPAISMAASSFVSPLVAVAIHATSCRKSAIFGGIVLALGLILSYFAQNIGALIAIYGLLTGIGYGFARISCLVLASHYFQDRYGIAASVIFTGFGLGRFIFSPLVQISNQEYGVQGTFLLLGGITLNICVGASLFQPAHWHYVLRPIVIEKPGVDQKKSKDGAELENGVEMIEHDRLNSVITNKEASIERDSERGNGGAIYKEHPEDESSIVQLTNYRKMSQVTATSLDGVIENGPLKSNGAPKEVVAPEAKSLLHDEEKGSNAIKSGESRTKTDSSFKEKLAGSLDFTLLKESVFYVILGSQVLTYLSLMYGSVFFPTLCLDKGLTKMESAILPTFRAAAEILGRIAIPFLQSISNLDPIVFYILTCFAASLAFMAQALVEGYYLILLTGLCTGCLTGGTVVQNTTITLISVGKNKLPSTLGLCAFFTGFFILLGGPLIGRVRDVTGSLVYGYLLITAFQLACAFVWIFRYVSLRNTKRSTKSMPKT